ncbi:diphosphomevalonate decarboxylase [Acholeplasma hippikon]|nr:diphosphomevalonate decarboxylase [Acholeplasma hippikon]
MKATAKAHVNIALIKYWGKKDIELNLPLTSSLSFTLDKFYTKTTVHYKKELIEDQLYIDQRYITGPEYERVTKYLSKIRQMYNIPYYAMIESENYVPKKAGVASSSSAFAALALAATRAYGIDLSEKELSSLARLGSGSAARSIYGGFAFWNEGYDHLSSYAEPFNGFEDMAVLVCMVDDREKKISSRDAMLELTKNEENKNDWIENTNDFIEQIKEAFINDDFDTVGGIAESHAMLMHYYMQEDGIDYLTDQSFKIIDLTEKLRGQGFPVYATMDAGPNVKILTKKEYIKDVIGSYEKLAKVTVCYKGEGAKII